MFTLPFLTGRNETFGFAVGDFIGHASGSWVYRSGSRNLLNVLDLYSDVNFARRVNAWR